MNSKRPLRLRKRAEFLSVRQGEKRRGPLFLLEVKERNTLTEASALNLPRVGFTVTKKNGNAVKRNRIKRRLREAVRVGLTGDMASGTDYVIVARPEALKASFARLTQELNRRIEQKTKNEKVTGRI